MNKFLNSVVLIEFFVKISKNLMGSVEGFFGSRGCNNVDGKYNITPVSPLTTLSAFLIDLETLCNHLLKIGF